MDIFEYDKLKLIIGNYPYYSNETMIDRIKKFEIEMLLRILSYFLFVENKKGDDIV